ncbi:MAG: MgtC/SapB family protein, partial [Thermodesulfobacteriota bacterium]|nr:MgtC/SapB family protein [Thermodesulfobacteriota bacterium]
MEVEVILFRLGVAAMLGLVLGYERELHGRSAGLRTNLVVAVSSCMLMIISLELEVMHQALDSSTVIRMDPGRIASYAVAGMGFLGAGAIIQGRGSVMGLTTAACLWSGNAIGLAVGAGFIVPAVAGTAFVLVALMVFPPIVHLLPRDTYMRVYMDFPFCDDKIPEITELLKDYNVKILYTGFDCRFDAPASSYE